MIEIEGTNYCIKVDEKNYTLLRKANRGEKSKRPGEEYHELVGHYPSLPWALQGFRRAMQRDKLMGDTNTLLAAIDSLKRLDDWFAEALGRFVWPPRSSDEVPSHE